jgi:hypothetical protein
MAHTEISPRVKDHAANILHRAGMVHDISESVAGRIWDDYYSARTSSDFVEKLNRMDIPNALKHELYLAHQQYRHVEPSRVEKVIAAIHRMGSKVLPLRHIEAGEKHPNVLKAFAESILKNHEE